MVKVQCLWDVAIKMNWSIDRTNVLVDNLKPLYWALWPCFKIIIFIKNPYNCYRNSNPCSSKLGDFFQGTPHPSSQQTFEKLVFRDGLKFLDLLPNLFATTSYNDILCTVIPMAIINICIIIRIWLFITILPYLSLKIKLFLKYFPLKVELYEKSGDFGKKLREIGKLSGYTYSIRLEVFWSKL